MSLRTVTGHKSQFGAMRDKQNMFAKKILMTHIWLLLDPEAERSLGREFTHTAT